MTKQMTPPSDGNHGTISFSGRTYQSTGAATPVTFAVSFEPGDGIYTATGDFHMMMTGDTRDELKKAVTGALEFLWGEYVTADPSGFSADAMALRDRLIQTFTGVKNPARSTHCRDSSRKERLWGQ